MNRASTFAKAARGFFAFPALGYFCRDRRLSLAFLGAAAVLGLQQLAGWGLVRCPIRTATGWDCPGCGLTRGVLECCRGEWSAGVSYHAAAPAALAAGGAMLVAALLPGRARERWVSGIEAAERKTGLSAAILLGTVIYGLTRHWLFR